MTPPPVPRTPGLNRAATLYRFACWLLNAQNFEIVTWTPTEFEVSCCAHDGERGHDQGAEYCRRCGRFTSIGRKPSNGVDPIGREHIMSVVEHVLKGQAHAD
jgi:hypothetical protein